MCICEDLSPPVSPLSYIGPMFLKGGKTCKETLFLHLFVPQLVKVRGVLIGFKVALDRWSVNVKACDTLDARDEEVEEMGIRK